MTNEQITQSIINHIIKDGVNIPEYENNGSEVSHTKYGAYLLEFIVTYNREVTYYLESTYDNPREYDLKDTIKDISDVNVYINNDLQDLSDAQIDLIHETISKNI